MAAAGLRLAARGVLAASISGTAGAVAAVNVQPESSFSRTLRFWNSAMPVYCHYKWVEWQTCDLPDGSPEFREWYDPLNDAYAPKMERLALDMQGFYFKCAQVLSTRDEFLPEQYMSWMKKLQDRQPRTMAPDEVRGAVEASLGRPLDEVYADWEDAPIGAASIGQVHRATLRDTGEKVAVKLMMPGIEAKFMSDISTVEFFCKNLMPQHVPYFSEIKKMFATEFNYVAEAQNLAEVREMVEQSPFAAQVAVPRPIPELCTKEVLTMTYLEGDRLIDGVRQQYMRLAKQLGVSFEKMEHEQLEKMRRGEVVQRDIVTTKLTMTLLDWLVWSRDLMQNAAVLLGNYTIGPLVRDKPWEYVSTERPINLAHVMETLLRVHAHEIFFGGAFNSDPHPGNILLMPDGRLGLIDYGQFKRMTLEDRIIYAKVVLALHRDDHDEIVRLFTEEIGFRTKYLKKEVIWRAAAFWNDRDTEDVMQGRNVHTMMEFIEQEDPPVQVNDEFVMVARVSILLRGMANAFGLKLRVSDYWHIEAERFLKEQGIKY